MLWSYEDTGDKASAPFHASCDINVYFRLIRFRKGCHVAVIGQFVSCRHVDRGPWGFWVDLGVSGFGVPLSFVRLPKAVCLGFRVFRLPVTLAGGFTVNCGAGCLKPTGMRG